MSKSMRELHQPDMMKDEPGFIKPFKLRTKFQGHETYCSCSMPSKQELFCSTTAWWHQIADFHGIQLSVAMEFRFCRQIRLSVSNLSILGGAKSPISWNLAQRGDGIQILSSNSAQRVTSLDLVVQFWSAKQRFAFEFC